MSQIAEDGKIQVSHEVYCAACEQYAGGLGRTKTEAAQTLRYMGWQRIAKLGWCCNHCVQEFGP